MGTRKKKTKAIRKTAESTKRTGRATSRAKGKGRGKGKGKGKRQEVESALELLDEEWRNTWAQIVVKAWTDERFCARLLAEPKAVAREEGLALPKDIQLRVVQHGGARIMELPLPPRPDELDETEVIDHLADEIGTDKLFCCCC